MKADRAKELMEWSSRDVQRELRRGPLSTVEAKTFPVGLTEITEVGVDIPDELEQVILQRFRSWSVRHLFICR